MLLNIRGLKHQSEYATSDMEMSVIEFQAQSRSSWGGFSRFKRRRNGEVTHITTLGANTTSAEGTLGIIEEESRD